MSTLILSDRIESPKSSSIRFSSWTSSRPSAGGYDIVILDLYFGPPSKQGYYEIPNDYANFYELGGEVAKSLQGGGVVIALLGPVAVTTRNLTQTYAKELLKVKQKYHYESKYIKAYETSYDWLDQSFLKNTEIDEMSLKPTEGITVVSPRSEMQAYAEWVSRYWVSISFISPLGKSKTDGNINYRVAQTSRWKCSEMQECSAKILALGRHTRLPVAAAIKYMNWDGVLVLLPPLELKSSIEPEYSEEVSRLCHVMESLAKGIKEDFATLEAFEHEEWVFEHRAPQAKSIVSQLDELKQKQNSLTQGLEKYDQMLALLDGTGDALVDSVAALFDKPGEGIRVERTEKGASMDLFVHDSRNRRLVIEVTGIKAALKKGDPHWADFLEYMPEHHERNENERVERIVLVANTECKTKLDQRNRTSDITSPVKNTVTDNHICLIRSCDLYQLWLQTVEGLPIQTVFDMLFDCDGVFQPKQ